MEAADHRDLEDDTVRRIALSEAVGLLEERDRDLIALRYGADLTARQIAELQGVKTNAIEVALHRALRPATGASGRERLGACKEIGGRPVVVVQRRNRLRGGFSRMRSWRRNRETGLEAELRANRPEPSRELVHQLEARVRQDGRQARGTRSASRLRARFRWACCGARFGRRARLRRDRSRPGSDKATRIVHVHGVTHVHKSAARDQYGKPKGRSARKGKKRVKGKCKKIKKARGVSSAGRPSPGRHAGTSRNDGAASGRPVAFFGTPLDEVMNRRFLGTALALALLATFVLVLGAGAGTARGPRLSLAWQAPTPARRNVVHGDCRRVVHARAVGGEQRAAARADREADAPGRSLLTAAYGNPGLRRSPGRRGGAGRGTRPDVHGLDP